MIIARKINILGATFATNNMGVGALTSGTIRTIRHEWPDAQIQILDYGKEADVFRCIVDGKTVEVPLVNLRFSKNIFLTNHVIYLILLVCISKVLPGNLREKILDGNAWLCNIRSAVLSGSIAGGDSFSDIYGMKRFFYVTLPQILVLLLGKKLIQLPQTYGPYKGRLGRSVARWILRRSEQIYSRDFHGIEELKELLGTRLASKKVRFSYDMGFALEPIKPAELDLTGLDENVEGNPSVLVGLNVSGLLYMGGYNRDNMFGLRLDYSVFTNDLIKYLILSKGARILLVPHVFGSRMHTESDSTVCRAIFERLKERYKGKLFFAQGPYDQGQIKWVIGRCDLFIGARMHACIAALSQCIPTAPVAYSKKFFGVMETIGVDSFVVDARVVDFDGAIRIVDDLFDRRKEIQSHLEKSMPEVKKQALRLFSRIEEDRVYGDDDNPRQALRTI